MTTRTSPIGDRQLITRYLLRELAENEQETFEAGYFASPEAFEELLAAENELIDAYLDDRLPPPERERFELFFLDTPARRERLELARGLKTIARRSPAAPPPAEVADLEAASTARRGWHSAAQWWAAAATVALVLTGGVLTRRLQGLHGELERARSAQAAGQTRQVAMESELAALRARADRLQQELKLTQTRVESLLAAAAHAPVQAIRMATLTLLPGLRRDPQQRPTLPLPPGVERIRLRLRQTGSAYAKYSASVETPDGDTVLTREPLRLTRSPLGDVVDLPLESKALPDGHYVIVLRGIGPGGRREDVADYAFRLLRSN